MVRKRTLLSLKNICFQVLLLLLSGGLLNGVFAQTSTVGSISGAVRDTTGAAVPKADIVIQELRTGFKRTVTTNQEGLYSAPSLPVGRYSVTVAPTGFKKMVVSGDDGQGLELHVSDSMVINITLQVGEVTETVNVEAGAVTVETRSGNVASLVSEKQVTQLPLNGRNYAQLALMVPGVSPATTAGADGTFSAGGTGLSSGVDMSVNGNASNQNLWTVDGVNNMDVGSNRTLLVFPSIDSIQEFKVERNSFSAEFGQAQGAVINLVTKGGSNQFHGTAFEFLRNDALNAGNFFKNLSTDPKKPALRYNNFGGNFSGPVIKNKAFFFWNEEWRREKRGILPQTQKVPTAAEKQGNFSGALTGPVPLDPFNFTVVNGVRVRQPFAGNIIPAGRLSPAALAILKVYPDPNIPGAGNNWIGAPVEPISTRQDTLRGDIVLNTKMNLMVRWINESWNHDQAAGNFWGDTAFPTLSSDWEQPSYSFAVKLSTALSSTAVNEFQFSRAGNDIGIKTSEATDALNKEIASKFPTVFPREEGVGLPTMWGTDGYATLWHQAPWTNEEDLYIWKDDFSKVLGAHDLKFGALFSHNIKNETNVGANEAAQFGMTNNRTGNAIADLLLRDLPLNGYTERDHREFVQGRWRDLEFYANNNWKVRRRLTLNVGVRWSRYSPAFSNNDRISNYVPSLFNGTNVLSGLVSAGDGDTGRSPVRPYNSGIQPRIGIAYDLTGDGKTALRIGFGRFLSRSNVIEDLLRLAANPPWTNQVTTDGITGFSSDPTAPLPSTMTGPGTANFRSLDAINGGVRNNVQGVGANSTFNAISPDFRPPQSYQWNMTLSRELLKDTVLEASYIGNRGTHIWRRGINFNDILPGARLGHAQLVANNQSTTAYDAANRRFPGLGPILMSESTGNSSYHAFQVWVNRRFSDRLAFQGSYSWGHAITDVPLAAFSSQTTDPFNYSLDRGDADLDRRQIFTFNAVYNLPSFKNFGPTARSVIGDWQFNVIGSFLSGPPIDVIYTNNAANSVAGTAAAPASSGFRPNLVSGVPIYLERNGIQYLNRAAFAIPALGQFGSLGRGAIRQPGTETVDFSIAKNWKMKERYGLQFRAEMFNAFNHTNFNGFSNNMSNSDFGNYTSTLRAREIQFGLKFSF